jgi:hypothetical protein
MILFINLPLNELYILLIDFELDDLITKKIGTTIIEYIMKYEMHAVILLILNIDDIHPICPIDEYANRDRKWIWLIPRIPPISAFMVATPINISSELDLYEIEINNDSGASFCQVDRIKQFIHEIDNITDGYQKWHGAIPNLISIDNIIMTLEISCILSWFISLIPRSIIIDPIACERKYLIDASVSWFDFDFIIIGINLNILSSNIIHAIIQFGLNIVIMVLNTNIEYIVYMNGDWFSIKDLEELNPLLMVRSL